MEWRLAIEISDVDRAALVDVIPQPEVPRPLSVELPQHELAEETPLRGVGVVFGDGPCGERGEEVLVENFTIGRDVRVKALNI